MNRRLLGKTGVAVTEIGLGTWDYHAGPEPLRKGLAAGALFIDTAESYGTEAVVAAAIHGLRHELFLATKVSAEHLRRNDVLQAADRSLRLLRTDYLDLYQIHEPNSRVPMEETLAAMEELVEAGKVRFIGVSNFSLAQLRRAKAALTKYPLVSNQIRYNLVDRTPERDLLPYCQANGILVIAYSPLGRELRRVRDCDPHGVLEQVAQEAGKTLPQVILNWCLSHPGVVAIPKGNSVEHVLDNCGASGWSLTADARRRLDVSIRFRYRSRTETILRRLVPGRAGPLIKRWVQKLPPDVRRRLN